MNEKLTPLEQMVDDFESVGIHIRAKINRLCNLDKYEEAELLEKAYFIIFGDDTEQIRTKVENYYYE